MKSKNLVRALVALFAVMAIGGVPAQAAPQAAPAAKQEAAAAAVKQASPLSEIAWLTGGTWVAEIKGEKGEPLRIENRIRWSDNAHLIKFITTFISHNRPQVRYEGIYAWDPAKKQIGFWYTDNEGNFTQGTAAMSGETLTQEFEISHAGGRVDKLRSVIVRDNPDSYRWSVSAPKDGKWTELIHLTYTREK